MKGSKKSCSNCKCGKQQKKKFEFKMSDKVMNALSWGGTACMLFSPYLLQYQIGYVLGATGVALITPPCYKNKQWNLVFLNTCSFIGYSLQFLNIL